MKIKASVNLLFTYCLAGVSLSAAAEEGREFGSVIEEVVVTVQKRAESVQDIPVAISVFGEKFIANTGAATITDLITYTPGLSGNTSGATTNVWGVRGIATNDFTAGSDPSVGVFIDEAYIGRNVTATNTFFDVSRVEVVKGPQGTLFGRNAVAGAIHIITNKPEDENTLDLGIGLGNKGQEKYELVGNLALSHHLALRVAYLQHEKDGDIVKNVVTGEDSYYTDKAGRISVRYPMSDDLELLFSVHRFHMETNRMQVHSPFLMALAGGSTGLDDLFSDRIAHDTVDTEENDSWGYNLRLAWIINDNITFTSITDSRAAKFDFEQDLDATAGFPLAGIGLSSAIGFVSNADSETYSQEFRLNGSVDAVDWFIGASWFEEDINDLSAAPFYTFGLQDSATTMGEFNAVAVYGDAAWNMTDKFSLTLGVRWTEDKKDWCLKNVAQVLGSLGADTLGQELCLRKTWTDTSPRVVLDWQMNEATMLYASYSEGYKAGAMNSSSLDSDGDLVGDGVDFADPEQLKAYEVGMKSTLLGGAMQFNAAAYLNDYTDLQVQILDFRIQLDNAAEAVTKGLELELVYQPPVEGLQLTASYAYNDNEYTDGAVLGVDVEGNQLIQAPEKMSSVTVSYEVPLADLGKLHWFMSYSYRSDLYVDVFNSEFIRQPALELWGARVSFQPIDGNWSISLVGDNLKGEDYYAAAIDAFSLGASLASRSDPRLWRFEAAVHF